MCSLFMKAFSLKLFTIYIVIFGFFIFISACEGYRWAEGTIYDFDTKQPIDSVLCTVKSGRQKQYSDSLGKYYVHNPMGGCMPDCKDIIVEFSKIGYETQTVTNPSDIFLKKE